jgi:hypothetical protein
MIPRFKLLHPQGVQRFAKGKDTAVVVRAGSCAAPATTKAAPHGDFLVFFIWNVDFIC